MALQPDISDELLQLVFMAIDHAIDSLTEGTDILTPFVFVMGRGQRRGHRFVADDMGEALERAKTFISELDQDSEQYALAFDGFVSVGDEKADAVIIEAGERGQAFGHIFAQRYTPTTEDAPLQTIGSAGYLGQGDQYFG